MAVHMKYPFKRFSTLARVAGANYRLLARLDHHRSAHYGRLWAMWIKMEMPFNLWIRRGRLLNPYISGVIIDFLRKERGPRDLKLVPDELFSQPGMKTYLHSWSVPPVPFILDISLGMPRAFFSILYPM
ncbi:hypothetical protein CJ030_MR2G012817 [Morella rubra]|uniref:Uncharacterized protein n=1 Tax=Morella rubra TaxID=262757 RepID=A0A6A1W7E1_9ROSI|nr:hypothetical protein CJ030_MR2G012817 [Morella rubra]